MTNPLDQARRYVAKIPGAVSGSGGHAQTFSVATALVNGFALSNADALALLSEYNGTCSPPWSEPELHHKIESAANTPHDKARGHLIRANVGNRVANVGSRRANVGSPAANVEFKTEIKPVVLNHAAVGALPDPIDDGTRELLRTVFNQGEFVRIVAATLNEEGREVPENRGPCLSREDWLKRLDEHEGNPNGIWKSADRTGLYITINPMKSGGSKDDDVTAYRHALIEFDSISKEEQWALYQQSEVPCSAIISSGGKSIHAWVLVDAKDRGEYDERVKAVHDYFSSYGLDIKNKNPSRLSRLPGCVRFSERQELLSLRCGKASFAQWLGKIQASGIGKEVPLDDLIAFEPENDADCLIGNRWLCKGGSMLFVGQSGIGKSSLSMQMALTWALGRSVFGITPKRPLKSLIIQAENDTGDTAEMFQGVLAGLELSSFSDEFEVLRSNLKIIKDSSHTGELFTRAVARLIDIHRPDIVWLDPLLSFIGADISKQEVCGEFLRNWLNPISDATGVAWMMMHHTGKPSNDPKAQKGWKTSDFSYYGIGSSELTNWARGVVVLRSIDGGQYELKLAKRGPRAGATELDGAPTDTVTLKHSTTGICWHQAPASAPDDSDGNDHGGGGRPSKLDSLIGNGANITGIGLGPFLDACTEAGEGKNEIARRLEQFAAASRMDVKLGTCKSAIEALVSRGTLRKCDDAKYRKS